MENKYQKKIITIPNILSFFRLCLIPFFVWQYCIEGNYKTTALLLLLSGLTDIADGYIARHFNMISDFGKALDPVADKLTQFSMMACLVTRFKLMIIPSILIVIKEITTGVTSLVVIKKTGEVNGAVWHGKLTTVLIYSTIIIHLLWYNIPTVWSNVLIIACVCMMLVSFVLYFTKNMNLIKKAKKKQ